MKLTISILTLAGGILPGGGVWLLWRRVSGRRKDLRRKLQRYSEIMNDPALSDAERSRRVQEEVPSESTWGDVLHIRERIELVGLDQAPEVTAPAILASLGLACATTAGLLSTWFD
ncbi:hypothetical protein [Streptomyces sp. RK9]|uniref:hypothetical protein n=1 Tax=Streptomyces sp. RK9 TaxID=3239284 RepID=UPI00386CDD74